MSDVTLVIATHNRPEMLRVELESMLAAAERVQEDVRLLVVDDASEGMQAKHIADEYGAAYLRNDVNLGVGGTLARGFAEVDSPFYSFWGDDDFMLPHWFELHLAKMAEGYDVVGGSYLMADAELRPTAEVILPVATFEDLKRGDVKVVDSALVRRSSLGPIRYRPERERAMMMTFWLAMAAADKKFAVIPEPTFLYRRHAGNMSNRRTPHDNQLRREAIAEYL